MNLRAVVIASVSILVGISLAMFIVSSTAALVRARENEKGLEGLAPHWGRYQIASSNGNVFLNDSVTGECWTPANGHWQRVAPPISELRP